MFVLGPLLNHNVAAMSGTAGATGTTWSATTDWTLTNGNLTAERTANTNTSYRMILGTDPKTAGTISVTVNALGANGLFIGLEGLTNTTFPGDSASAGMGYKSDGNIWAGGAIKTAAASYTVGDVIKVVLTLTDIKFYKNNVLQWTETFGFGSLYPAMSDFNSTGNKATLDASLWV